MATLSGIVKHSNGEYGFKVSFTDVDLANRYKDMLRWILVSDNLPLEYRFGYYDKEEYRDL